MEDNQELPPLPTPNIPNFNILDSYGCSECKSEIEIESIDKNKNEITFICIKNNHYKTLLIKEYINEMIKNTYKYDVCSICNIKQKDDPNKSIFNCCICDIKNNKNGIILCNTCWQKDINHQTHKYIKNNERLKKCLIHPMELNKEYCWTCKTHICIECLKSREHLGHRKNTIDELIPSEEEINKVNKDINNLKNKKIGFEQDKVKNEKNLENELERKQNKINKKYNLKVENTEKKYKKEIMDIDNKLKKEIYLLLKNFLNEIKKLKDKYNNYKKKIEDKIKVIKKNLEKNKRNKIYDIEKENKNKKTQILDYFNKNIENLSNLIKINEIIRNSYENYNENYCFRKNYLKIAGFNQKEEDNNKIEQDDCQAFMLKQKIKTLTTKINDLKMEKEKLVKENNILKNNSEKTLLNIAKEKLNKLKEKNKFVKEVNKKEKEILNQMSLKKETIKNIFDDLKKSIIFEETILNDIPKDNKYITQDSNSSFFLNKIFCFIKSILIYANTKKGLNFYDLIGNKFVLKKKNLHPQSISNIRYFEDTRRKRDIILTISSSNNNNYIKLYKFE